MKTRLSLSFRAGFSPRGTCFSALAVLFLLLLTTPLLHGQATDLSQIKIPPLREFHPQEPRRIALPNGMVVFLQENHELPIIGGTARIRGGSTSEPAAKTGLLDIYGEVWRTGGTDTRTGDQLDDYLEARAARVETGSSDDSTSISFNCLKQNLDDVFPIFLELLHSPAFREDKIELAKTQLNTGIARRNDDIGDIAGREAARLAYGKDNPYARIPEYATVAAVTRQDLLDWHARYVQPNNIILGIYGDFDPAAMEARLRRAFESWGKKAVPPPPQIDFKDPKPGFYFIAKEDVNQSAIRMVTLGTTRKNPDYYAIEVMNEVLGRGFTSRLVKSIRTEKGLAYAIGGGLGAAFDHPGIFRVSMGTKSGTTVESINALRAELEGMVKNPPTAEEIQRAKDSILNSFIFNFDSKQKVLAERMLYEFYGYPADFLERYRAGIEKTAIEDVARVARKYIHPDQFAVLVVGNAADFDKPLSTLGPVTPIDITIPEPGAAIPAASASAAPAKPAATTSEARALVQKFVDSIGGEPKVQAVKAVRQKSLATQNTPQGAMTLELENTVVYPDRAHATLRSEQLPGAMTMVVTPSVAFMSMPGAGVRDMPASLRQERLNSIRRDWLYLAQHLSDPKFAFVVAGKEKVGDAEAHVVEISGEGVSVRWFLDAQSGRLLRAAYQGMGQAGPVARVVDYSDWRPVDGLQLAFKRTVTENGQPSASEEIQEYQLNPPVDPKLFDKPAAEKPN